jgi:hypothetical protein
MPVASSIVWVIFVKASFAPRRGPAAGSDGNE